MKRTPRTAADLDDLIRTLVGIERATLRPFLTTRPEIRLDAQRAVIKPAIWIFRPLTLAISLALVLLLNLSAVVLFEQGLDKPTSPGSG